MKAFYERFNRERPKIQSVEKEFKLKIGDYWFFGRIDRIDDAGNGCVEIIDYKTGEAKGQELTAEDKRQLLLYQIAAEEPLELKLKKLSYYYLEDDSFVSVNVEKADKEKLKTRFVENIEKIRKGEFDPSASEFVCRYCEFNGICEFRKS